MTDEERVIAAELVIGLLTSDEQEQACERAASEPAFAREVEWWQDRLAPLLEQTRDEPPPPHLRDRIVARLSVPVLEQRRAAHRWRWVGLGGAIGALAASVAVLLITPDVRPPSPAQPAPVTRPDTILVASLAWSEDTARQGPVAVLDPVHGTVRFSSAIDVATGSVGQLWRIPEGGKPISLGLIPSDGGKRLILARAVAPVQGETLAVSVEPAGGSPTGQPTGPVILSGTLTPV